MQTRSTVKMLHLAGGLGLFGCLAVVAGNIAGVMIYERHDWISDTISDLAAGRWGWIQDAGMILFGLGILACGFGMRVWQGGGWAWKLASVALVLLAIDIAVIAAHNEYGDRDSGKFVIHMYAVYALSGLFPLAALLAVPGLRDAVEAGRDWSRFSLGIAAAWLVLSPLFFVVPTAWDGAYERVLGLVIVGWVAAIAWLLSRRAPLGVEA